MRLIDADALIQGKLSKMIEAFGIDFQMKDITFSLEDIDRAPTITAMAIRPLPATVQPLEFPEIAEIHNGLMQACIDDLIKKEIQRYDSSKETAEQEGGNS